MTDRLAQLLEYFHLKAHVFQAGSLCHTSAFTTEGDLGYLHILQQGTMTVKSASHHPLLVEEPSLILYMNSTQHHLIPKGENVLVVCASFHFGAGLINPIVTHLPKLICLKLKDLTPLTPSLNLLFQEAEGDHCGRQAVLDRLMEILLIQVLRDLMDENRIDFGLLAGLSHPKLVKALNAIHQEPANSWSLEELASIAGMSRSRFSNKFRDIVGITPGSYISEWRLCIAQSLLRKKQPLQLVADTVGYASASALSRSFKTHWGITPTEWVKSNNL